MTVSGSYAKGTAIRGVTLAPADVDVDLFLSLAEQQEALTRQLGEYRPVMANVSVKILVGNQKVDLTVGRRAAGGDPGDEDLETKAGVVLSVVLSGAGGD